MFTIGLDIKNTSDLIKALIEHKEIRQTERIVLGVERFRWHEECGPQVEVFQGFDSRPSWGALKLDYFNKFSPEDFAGLRFYAKRKPRLVGTSWIEVFTKEEAEPGAWNVSGEPIKWFVAHGKEAIIVRTLADAQDNGFFVALRNAAK